MVSSDVNSELERIIASSLDAPSSELHITNFDGNSIEALLQENVPTESLSDFLDLSSLRSQKVIKETRRRTTLLVFESRIAVTSVQGSGRCISIPSCLEWDDLAYELSDPPVMIRVHHDRGVTDVAATVSDVQLDAANQTAKFTCTFQLDLADLVAECSVAIMQKTHSKGPNGPSDCARCVCRGTADIGMAD
eukprot:GDKI01026335.1.p1 GENE.GDKI01026335.1~~GDKI01026335.1.p1  ORF type:complete len:192 (-),score=23.05 GDKI01026335.1:467-1042(-)